jgi:hypothetical protein
MKRSAFILLLMAVSLMIEPLASPWQARERRVPPVRASAARPPANESKPHPSLAVPLGEGGFVLKDLRLVRVGASTRLDGKLVNQTKRRWERITFALKAYDGAGRQLQGIERETIFSFNQLGKGKTSAFNSGYGVWLEGINFQSVARVEAVLLDAPRAAHSRTRASLSDIEE